MGNSSSSFSPVSHRNIGGKDSTNLIFQPSNLGESEWANLQRSRQVLSGFSGFELKNLEFPAFCLGIALILEKPELFPAF